MSKIINFLKNSILTAFQKFFITILYFTFIYFFIYFITNISLISILQDYSNKVLGEDSNLSKNLEDKNSLIKSYLGYKRYDLIQKTDNYVNIYDTSNIGRELSELENIINQNNLSTFKLFFKDLHIYHYDLVFNKFNYSKDRALQELYNIILKYRCSLGEAYQDLMHSNLEDNKKQLLSKSILSDRIFDILVETIVYTKTINFNQFMEYKEEKTGLIKDEFLWESLVQNYHFEFMNILKGGICEKNLFID